MANLLFTIKMEITTLVSLEIMSNLKGWYSIIKMGTYMMENGWIKKNMGLGISLGQIKITIMASLFSIK